MIIYIIFITIIVVGVLYFISLPGNGYLAYAEPKQNKDATGQVSKQNAAKSYQPKARKSQLSIGATKRPNKNTGTSNNFATGSNKKPLNDADVLKGLNKFGKSGQVSTTSNFYQDSKSGKFEYDKKTGKWFTKGSVTGSGSSNYATMSNRIPVSDADVIKGLSQFGIEYDKKTGAWFTNENGTKKPVSEADVIKGVSQFGIEYDKKTGKWFTKGGTGTGTSGSGSGGSSGPSNFAVGSNKKPLSDADVLKGLNQFGKSGQVSTTSNFYQDSKSGKFEYDKKTGTWFITGGGAGGGGSGPGNFAVGSNRKPLSDADVLKGLNQFGKSGQVSTTSNFYQDSKSGKFEYDKKTGTWFISGTGGSGASGSGNFAVGSNKKPLSDADVLKGLNQFGKSGQVSTTSNFYQDSKSGKFEYDKKTGTWFIKGVGGSASGSADPQYALKALNQYSADGNVSPSSSYYAAVQAGIYKYDDKTKSWYINTGTTGSGGGGVTGSGGQLPDAKTTVDQQVLRNLNRMYGNGKVPVSSDYASLVASGQVVWDDTNHVWMATTGSAVGYIGVGQATQQDVRNLNRLFPDGNVTVGSRFANLVASGNVAWDPTNKTWVSTAGKYAGYTGTGTVGSAPAVYVGTNADGSQYVTSGSGPVNGGSGYFPGVVVGDSGYVDPNAAAGYYDPNAAAGYVDPNAAAGYYDPNAETW